MIVIMMVIKIDNNYKHTVKKLPTNCFRNNPNIRIKTWIKYYQVYSVLYLSLMNLKHFNWSYQRMINFVLKSDAFKF